jgi:hypothetical protein
MTAPISIRPDESVRTTPESEAREHGNGRATYLRQLATDAAREVRRKNVRPQSAAMARQIAASPEARDFAEFRGTPHWDAL